MKRLPFLRVFQGLTLGCAVVLFFGFPSLASAEEVLQEDFLSWPNMESPGVSADWEAIGTSAQYEQLAGEEGLGAPLPVPEESLGCASQYLVRRSITVPSGTKKLIIEYRVKQGNYMSPMLLIGKIAPGFIEGYGVALTGSAPTKSGDIISKLDILELTGSAVRGLARNEEFTEDRAVRLAYNPATGIETREIPRGGWTDFRWEIESADTGVQMKLFLSGESEPILKASGTAPLFGETNLEVGFSFTAIGGSSPGLSQLSVQAVSKP